jgi:hypothetical protein
MTLIERLQERGLLLDQTIGFIVNQVNSENIWFRTLAVVGWVQETLSPEDEDHPGFRDYDPKFDLLVKWEINAQNHLSLVRNTIDTEFDWLKELNEVRVDSICMRTSSSIVLLGQTPTFIAFATSTAYGLKNRLH